MPALVFIMAACTPVAPPTVPPGGLDETAGALQRGNLPALRAALGHGKGHAARAREFATRLDPPAWLIVMGAVGREYDLAACRRAMLAGDDTALADALGFGEQALRADILQGGRTVFSRRSAGMDYYEAGPAPLTLLVPELTPEWQPSMAGYEVTAWGRVGERVVRLRIGRNAHGFSNLQAQADPALDAAPRARDGKRAATLALAGGQQLPDLPEEHWMGYELRVVEGDGLLRVLRFGHDHDGWYQVERTETTLQQRTDAERDRRLEVVRRTAASYAGAAGRWPRGLNEITLRPADLVDPCHPQSAHGWVDHDPKPPVQLALQQPAAEADIAVQCTTLTPGKGYRAITRAGQLLWLPQ